LKLVGQLVSWTGKAGKAGKAICRGGALLHPKAGKGKEVRGKAIFVYAWIRVKEEG
jgi:hypothetical protein